MAAKPKRGANPNAGRGARSDRTPKPGGKPKRTALSAPRVNKITLGRRSVTRTGADVVGNLDDALAAVLAKCLNAGADLVTAVKFASPQVTDPEILSAIVTKWGNDPLLLQAIDALNGSPWPELSADRRVRIAYDKHVSEKAFYLYTRSFVAADGDDLKKMRDAYETLKGELAAGTDDNDPMQAFARMAADAIKTMHTAPQVPIVPTASPIPVPVKES